MAEQSEYLSFEGTIRGLKLLVYRGSTLNLGSQSSALVNAANENLDHAGGIAGHIVKVGGQSIQTDSTAYKRQNGLLPITENCITAAGTLNFHCVIHAVGPRCSNNTATLRDKDQLVSTIMKVLDTAASQKLTTIVFPLISSGIFGFPIKEATVCHIEAIFIFAQQREPASCLKYVKIGLFGIEEYQAMLRTLQEKQELFDVWLYTGSPEEQVDDPDKRYCGVCQTIVDKSFVTITDKCCKKQCDYCVFEYQSITCLSCTALLPSMGFTRIYCRYCKRLEMDNLHSCRKICRKCYYDNPLFENLRTTMTCVCGTKVN